jgi:hypothetical protein
MMVVFIMEVNGVVWKIFMELWTSKWLHGEATFGQLFNKLVQATNKGNPKNFSNVIYAITPSLGK